LRESIDFSNSSQNITARNSFHLINYDKLDEINHNLDLTATEENSNNSSSLKNSKSITELNPKTDKTSSNDLIRGVSLINQTESVGKAAHSQHKPLNHKDIYNITGDITTSDFNDNENNEISLNKTQDNNNEIMTSDTQKDKSNFNYTVNYMNNEDNSTDKTMNPNNMSALERINELVLRSIERAKRAALNTEDNDSILASNYINRNLTNAKIDSSNLSKNNKRFSASTVKTYNPILSNMTNNNTNLTKTSNNFDTNLSMVSNDLNITQNNNLTNLEVTELTTPCRSFQQRTNVFDSTPYENMVWFK
jgi:hypothetical protein